MKDVPMKFSICLSLALVAALLAGAVFAANDVYLKMGSLGGGSTNTSHNGWSICKSVWFDAVPPPYQPSTFQLWLYLTKETDQATPPTHEAVAAHTPIDTVLLDIKRSGDSADYYYRMTLSNVTVVSATVETHTEELYLTPESIQWTYVEAGSLEQTATYATTPDGRSGFVTSNVDGDAQTDIADPDDDNDGSSDQDEFWAGTDPTDPDSLFRIQLVQMSATNGLLTWQSGQGRLYHIYRSYHPTGIYERITVDPVPADPVEPATQYEVPLGAGVPLFYVVSDWP